MTLLRLPPELLHQVLRYLSKSDLKITRQTCRVVGDAVVPLLFDTVYIAESRIDMEKARLLCSHFGLFVNEMRYSSLIYERHTLCDFLDENFEGFEELSSESEDEDDITGETLYKRLTHTQQRDLQLFWTLYCNLTDEQENFIADGDFQSQLCQLLQASPKLFKVTIHDRLGEVCSCYEALVDAGKCHDKPLPDATELFRAFKRSDQHYCYRAVSSMMSSSNNPMTHLLDALATTQVSIKDISVDLFGSSGLKRNALHMSGIQLPSESFQTLSRTLLGLTELTLRIETPYEWPFTITSYPYRPSILCVAINLRFLHLEITDLDDLDHLQGYVIRPNVFNALLGSSSFPKLECFFLSNIDGTEAEVLHFLRRSSNLKSLTLHWLYLTSGTWAHLIEVLRSCLRLDRIEVEDADGEEGEVYFEDLEPYSGGCYKHWASVVTRFFLSKGPNPFLRRTWQENRDEDKDCYPFCPTTSQ